MCGRPGFCKDFLGFDDRKKINLEARPCTLHDHDRPQKVEREAREHCHPKRLELRTLDCRDLPRQALVLRRPGIRRDGRNGAVSVDAHRPVSEHGTIDE